MRCEQAEREPREAHGIQLRRGSEVRGQYRKLKRGLQAKGMMPLLKNIVYLRHDKSIRDLISQVLRDLIPFCLIFVCRHMLSICHCCDSILFYRNISPLHPINLSFVKCVIVHHGFHHGVSGPHVPSCVPCFCVFFLRTAVVKIIF